MKTLNIYSNLFVYRPRFSYIFFVSLFVLFFINLILMLFLDVVFRTRCSTNPCRSSRNTFVDLPLAFAPTWPCYKKSYNTIVYFQAHE